jgi:hypothetical protein
MLPHASFTLLANNHIAELQRHAKSQRLVRASYPDRERTPRTPWHWANR